MGPIYIWCLRVSLVGGKASGFSFLRNSLNLTLLIFSSSGMPYDTQKTFQSFYNPVLLKYGYLDFKSDVSETQEYSMLSFLNAGI